MKSDQEVTADCNVNAFYGIHVSAESLKSFYNDLIKWFVAIRCPPDKLSIKGPGFSGKPVSFGRTHARLSKDDFTQLESINIYSMLPDGKIPTVDWWATASISLKRNPFFFIQVRSSLVALEDERTIRLVEKCASALNPEYGIGYYRNHNKGPGFYAIGLNYVTIDNITGDADEEAETVSKWGYEGMTREVYKDGIIRDIYPFNYLAEPHLKMQIKQYTLKDWIVADSSRGSLSKINDQMTLWEVAPQQIGQIRKILFKSGLIFDWRINEQGAKKCDENAPPD